FPEAGQVFRGEPGGADDGVYALLGTPGEVQSGGVEVGEVDHHGRCLGEVLGSSGYLDVEGYTGDAAERLTGRARVDGGHQFQCGIVGHRPTDGGTHLPGGPEDADRDAIDHQRSSRVNPPGGVAAGGGGAGAAGAAAGAGGASAAGGA